MAHTISEMTKEELREMIEVAVENVVEQKFTEILGDPDEGFEVRETLRERLLRQQQAVAAGERGQMFDDVTRELQLE